MSGIDAVRKIVETESQARRIIDEAKMNGEQIIAKARQEAEMMRQEAISGAQNQREEILRDAREKAEADAQRSDVETQQLLENYRKLAVARKEGAVDKAVELVLNA